MCEAHAIALDETVNVGANLKEFRMNPTVGGKIVKEHGPDGIE